MRGEKGFTLMELIIVIAIIGILATVAMPRMLHLPKKAKEAALKTDLLVMRDAIDQYYGDKGHYPPSLEALVEEGYLRKIPVDPFTKRNDTWVVVYEEQDLEEPPPETEVPETGEVGIIDVHSGYEGKALDGSLISEW